MELRGSNELIYAVLDENVLSSLLLGFVAKRDSGPRLRGLMHLDENPDLNGLLGNVLNRFGRTETAVYAVCFLKNEPLLFSVKDWFNEKKVNFGYSRTNHRLSVANYSVDFKQLVLHSDEFRIGGYENSKVLAHEDAVEKYNYKETDFIFFSGKGIPKRIIRGPGRKRIVPK